MNINDKYNLLRPQIADGDLILFHGTRLISKIIQWCDSSYYNHIGVVTERHGALFIVDASSDGVQADRLSYRINGYKNGGDFTIIKSLKSREEINLQMKILLARSDGNTIKYDYNNGSKELFNRKFKNRFKINNYDNHNICTKYVCLYSVN